jgi:hypothetical protein
MNTSTIYIRLSELTAWELNPKDHDIPFIKGLIRQYGFVQYPAIRNKQLFAGHGRVLALLELKRDGSPIPRNIREDSDGDWLVHLSDADAAKFAIQDNLATRKGEWNKGKLKKVFEAGKVAATETGFSPKQLRRIMEEGKKKAEPSPYEQRGVAEVPDAQFPQEAEFGITMLDIEMQADYAEWPFIKWGTQARSDRHDGTVYFYTDDAKFKALLKNPLKLVDTGCLVAVEPNFTTYFGMPRWRVLQGVGEKRHMARLWQSEGVRIIVDLNVAPRWGEDNLRGVPRGWGAYATRALAGQEKMIEDEYRLACKHADGKPHLFVVYGGGVGIAELCEKRDWVWVNEYMREVKRKYGD